jgi:hypothetical protein
MMIAVGENIKRVCGCNQIFMTRACKYKKRYNDKSENLLFKIHELNSKFKKDPIYKF